MLILWLMFTTMFSVNSMCVVNSISDVYYYG